MDVGKKSTALIIIIQAEYLYYSLELNTFTHFPNGSIKQVL